MESGAELTLGRVRAAQEALQPLSSSVDWVIFPDHEQASWPRARALLTAASKPLIVAPLLEPGWVALWSIPALAPARRDPLEREFANQGRYFHAKLAALGLDDDDRIETPDAGFSVSAAEFRQWAAEFTIPVGLGMVAGPSGGTGRLWISPPGGGPPVGWVPPSS